MTSTTEPRTYADLPIAHWFSISVYLLLIGLLTLTTWWPNPVDGASKTMMLVIKLLPLLILLPGLWKGRNMTYIWAAFVILLYFMQASMSAYLNQWAWPPTTAAILTTLFFCGVLWKLKSDPGNPGVSRQR